MSERCLVNGLETSAIAAADRGLQYGDGLFETMALLDGRVRGQQLHLDRLQAGCARLGISFPGREAIERDIARLGASEGRAVLKLIVTRGVGGRGYAAPAGEPTRVLSLHPWPDHPAEWATAGVALRVCELRLADQPALAGLKHLNRLEHVLARCEWSDPEIAEGVLCDARGHVVCGTMSNVFAVRRGQIVTPRLDRSGVAGTVRSRVLQWARDHGTPAEHADLTPDQLMQADEVFLTNAIIGIWPVRRLGAREWQVGPVTRRLLAATG